MLFCTGSVEIRIDVSICIVYRIIIRFIDSSPSQIKIGEENLLVLIFFHELISKTTTSGKDKPKPTPGTHKNSIHLTWSQTIYLYLVFCFQ